VERSERRITESILSQEAPVLTTVNMPPEQPPQPPPRQYAIAQTTAAPVVTTTTAVAPPVYMQAQMMGSRGAVPLTGSMGYGASQVPMEPVAVGSQVMSSQVIGSQAMGSQSLFDALDRNRDGVLTREEFEQGLR